MQFHKAHFLAVFYELEDCMYKGLCTSYLKGNWFAE